jgi:hypothetical protein
MTDHHSEELLGLLDRIKEFVRTHVYPLEPDFLRRPFRELIPALNTAAWALRCRSLRLSAKSWAARRLVITCSTARRPTSGTWKSC